MKLFYNGVVFVFFIGFIFQFVYSESLDPLVTIPTLGQVRGSRMFSFNQREFLAFRGIPYAQPPVGELRFREPVYVNPWTGTVLDATKEGPSCIQHDSILQTFRGVEDCLRLNIYTHQINPTELKPVMVWIHGGGFNTGSGNGESDFSGPNYLLDRDIVLVTINYRLGALGFFTTEDVEAPGNYGLIDQSLALKWVQDHIRNFGGNPDSVTIFGESAGGASVEFQILSPHSKGLFHRAISQSGSTMCPWALSQSRYSQLFIQEMKCQSSSSKKVMGCLRSKPAEEIANFNEKTKFIGLFPFDVFTPRIDVERETPFLPAHPKDLIKQGRFNSVPYISGMNANEGLLWVAPLIAAEGKLMRKFESDPIKYTKNMVSAELRADGDDIAQRLNDQYFTKGKKFEEQLTEMEKMFSDTLFFKPIQDAVNLFSRYSQQPVYYYELGHIVQNSFTKFFGVPSEVLQGVCHADELVLMFSSLFIPTITTPADIKVSKIIIDLWTSFAKNGVPESGLLPSSWLPLEANTHRHLKIHATNSTMLNQSMPFFQRLSALEGLFENSSAGKDEL